MRRIYLTSTIILLVAVIIFALAAKFFAKNQSVILPIQKSNQGIEVFLPKENEVISSPLKITGVVSGNGWTGFEGQVGVVKLLDSKRNELATSILTATTEWTILPTSFETTLDFTSPLEESGEILFKNENASGEKDRDKTFTMHIKFK